MKGNEAIIVLQSVAVFTASLFLLYHWLHQQNISGNLFQTVLYG